MTQAAKEKGRARSEHAFVNAQGAEVKTRDEAFGLPVDVSPEAVATESRLTLHNGAITFVMTVKYNPNTYPHVVTGGQISSGICGAPWNITGGFVGRQLRLDAKRAGSGSCAETITIVGEYQDPPAYRGTYGFNGESSSFKHTTRYEC